MLDVVNGTSDGTVMTSNMTHDQAAVQETGVERGKGSAPGNY